MPRIPGDGSAAPNDPGHAALHRYLELLTDRHRVLVMDFPNLGKSSPIPADELTAYRVVSDLLATADEAGFERVAWWGFSWGDVIALQLASRSHRISALVCGGWPPLGGPHADLLTATRSVANTPDAPFDAHPFVTFYERVQAWPEAEAVTRLTCPRMAYFGSADEVDLAGNS